MNKLEKTFQKINPIIIWLGKSPWLQAISISMVSTVAITLIGSLSVLLMVLPVDSVHQFFIVSKMMPVFNNVTTCTLGILAIYVTFFMARNLVRQYNVDTDSTLCGIAAIMAFLIVTPMADDTGAITAIPLTWLGVQGVFSAMLIGLSVGRLFIFIIQRGWTLRLPKGVPPMIGRVFEGLFPFVLVGIVFLLINRLFIATPWENVHQCIYTLIQQPLKGLGKPVGVPVGDAGHADFVVSRYSRHQRGATAGYSHLAGDGSRKSRRVAQRPGDAKRPWTGLLQHCHLERTGAGFSAANVRVEKQTV